MRCISDNMLKAHALQHSSYYESLLRIVICWRGREYFKIAIQDHKSYTETKSCYV